MRRRERGLKRFLHFRFPKKNSHHHHHHHHQPSTFSTAHYHYHQTENCRASVRFLFRARESKKVKLSHFQKRVRNSRGQKSESETKNSGKPKPPPPLPLPTEVKNFTAFKINAIAGGRGLQCSPSLFSTKHTTKKTKHHDNQNPPPLSLRTLSLLETGPPLPPSPRTFFSIFYSPLSSIPNM